ncbi:hypothetical protein PUNSTDRAFT_44783 [Punctularia strigosozonata HHB-11173 SS5]|uniref:uncharacterized protein n=1 Tax=Punctularia strigosozonata (strain HHB-11173) TaxID=741275 RepID=UPI00044181D7|nr:uncharacterized protein PUNSTDRAFT_44783 [Punctularia strigosozonata HHB-11173 SS5]EIN08216.1 hypothetical protein PUNSTDRAFT_44783 [Punctularia strigosozonata HHB-11173 SS5]
MPELQLPVAAVLVAGAMCSLVSYAAAHREDAKEGKIKLSAYAGDTDVTMDDAFNVTEAEDIIEGDSQARGRFGLGLNVYVHLIPAGASEEVDGGVNANIFRKLDSPVSKGGDNFSTGRVGWEDYSTARILFATRSIPLTLLQGDGSRSGRSSRVRQPQGAAVGPIVKVYSLCKASGKEEFAVLKKLAVVWSRIY